MRTQAIFSLAFAAIAAAAPQGVPDKPIDFVVSVFPKSDTCDAATGGQAITGVGCVNRTLAKGGSALVRASVSSPNGFVTGYSGADCTGTAVVVFAKTDGCTNLSDVEVKSWIGKAPFEK